MPSRYRWNAAAGRYVDKVTGRFVPEVDIRTALDVALEGQRAKAKALADSLRQGSISLQQWEVAMRRVVKDSQLYGGAAAKGGWAQLAPADFGRIGAEVKKQYELLHNFARQISTGAQLLDGTVGSRAGLYSQAGRHTFHLVEQREMLQRGKEEERNILDPTADHCDGCRREASRGWVPIGTLVPVGERTCNMNDRCRVEYR